ncbi:MAG TPA: hypothetical protein VMU71_11940 [Terracidiphilus sp.]|nr:hypothetical protein [Terracidiphilus sp.]
MLLRATFGLDRIPPFLFANQGLGLAAFEALQEKLLAQAVCLLFRSGDSGGECRGVARCGRRFGQRGNAAGGIGVRCAGSDPRTATALSGASQGECPFQRVKLSESRLKAGAVLLLFQAADAEQTAQGS